MSSGSPFRFASALSTQADVHRAVDEVCRQALEQLQAPVHLAVLFVSASYRPSTTAWRRACQRLDTDTLLGGTGESIVGTRQEMEEKPAVSLWLAHMDGVRLVPDAFATGTHSGWGQHRRLARRSGRPDWPSRATMLVMGDPFSFPADLMVERLNEDRPDLCVMGGMASGAAAPGECRLFLGTTRWRPVPRPCWCTARWR